MRSEDYGSWLVCLFVCLSVKSHLTSGASVHPENAVTYSACSEGQKICGVFSETTPLQRSSISLCCTASEGTHSLGIGFLGLKRLVIGQRLPGIRVNVRQRPTFLSAAPVSVSCLAIFRIRPVTRNSLRLLPGYIPYTSVTRAFY